MKEPIELDAKLRQRGARKGVKAMESAFDNLFGVLRDVDGHYINVPHLRQVDTGHEPRPIDVNETLRELRRTLKPRFEEVYAQREIDSFLRDFDRLRQQVAELEAVKEF